MKLIETTLPLLLLLLIFHNSQVESVDLEFKLYEDEFDIETRNEHDLLQPESILTRSAISNANSSFDKCGPGINCRNHEVCNMQIGLCACAPNGFVQVSGTCEDLDECATGQHTCNGISEECLNNFGSFVCICKKGFNYMPAVGCIDVDECTNGTFVCPANTMCINVVGSFRCPCSPGYQFYNGCVKDPCEPPPCQNNCTCVSDLATNSFTCDNTHSAYAGENCTARRSMYECSAENITIAIPLDYLQYNFPPSKLALNENANISYKTFIGESRKPECELVESVESWGIVYSLDLHSSSGLCDTKVEVRKDTNGRTVGMTYNSTVWWVRYFTSIPGVSIPYQILSVVCDVDLAGNVDFNFNSKIAEDKPLQRKDGTPNLQMTFWKVPPTATYEGIPLERPFQYAINENLHVLVEIKSIGNVYKNHKVFLDHCYLADKEEKQREFAVIANGCAAEASPFTKVVLVNGASSYAHFYFTLINFPIAAHQVYVKCDVKLCGSTCVPNCNRMKRHADDAGMNIIPIDSIYKTKNGPIDLTKKNETKDANNDEALNWFVRSYAEIAILCVCNIAFLCFIGFMFYLLGKHVTWKRRLLLSAAMCVDPPPSISPISIPRGGAETKPHTASLLSDPKQKGRMQSSKKISNRYARTPYNSPFPS